VTSDAGPHPPYNWPDYTSTRWRAPHRPLVPLPENLTEVTGPVFGGGQVGEWDNDLSLLYGGEPLGQRIIVHGQVVDGDGRPIPDTLIEVWQANAAGRYHHAGDERDSAPLDPHFSGAGRTMTDAEGRYRFVTIKPGAYPWKNHHNAWRPSHIHFSVFGRSFAQRLVTQMYFPDDPLFPYDPILASVPEAGRSRLVAAFDLDATKPEWALAFRWDVVLRSCHTVRRGGSASRPPLTPAQTVGRFTSLGLDWPDGVSVVDPATPGAVRIAGRLLDGRGDPVADGLIETWQAAPDGRFPQPGDGDTAFRGIGRSITNGQGAWEIFTLKPAPLPAPDGSTEAPHVDVSVFARGLLHRLVTRIYFADEEVANKADPVLAALPDDATRATLVARPVDGGYRIDIHLQGSNETVFFAL
jgi:protocatechuate 3,4-dioxygenase, beta subunit